MKRPADRCGVCKALTNEQLVELDLLMGDASRWPRTLWRDAGWDPPKGTLPAGYRMWGRVKVGQTWLREHGVEVTDHIVDRHAKHVPMVASDPADLAELGVIDGSQGLIEPRADPPIDPNLYLRYYARGVELGALGLDLLEKRVQKMIADEKEVPLDLLKMLVEVGSKLATSQASIRARGVELHKAEDDDAFRRATDQARSPRLPGGTRIRLVDGVEVLVADGGPADRTAYAERAREEGSPRLS